MKKHIAVDLGATSGRVAVGTLDHLEVVHRFDNHSDQILGNIFWKESEIFSQVKIGLKKAFKKYGAEIASISIDTWGVDYALIDSAGVLVSPVYHYRDNRTDGMVEKICEQLGGKGKIYAETGAGFYPYNTLYQLAAHKELRPSSFKAADKYMSFPDLLNYWLTGVIANEQTHASTTQLLDPATKAWNWNIIDAIGFPRSLFSKVIPSGTVLGPLTEALQAQLGASDACVVIAGATHDTASAVAAIPAADSTSNYLFISSGTWSLLGVEIDQPIRTTRAMAAGFTNELCFNGKIRFLENIVGMWIQMECVRYWREQGATIQWDVLARETLAAEKDFKSYINPLDPLFLKPNSHNSLMVDRICAHCRANGMTAPATKGQFLSAIYRGLAKAYAKAIRDLENIVGKRFDTLHIIGGGCNCEILDQWTSDETGMKVFAGPVEATALGNILIQCLALKEVGSLQEGRNIIKNSQKVKEFLPQCMEKKTHL